MKASLCPSHVKRKAEYYVSQQSFLNPTHRRLNNGWQCPWSHPALKAIPTGHGSHCAPEWIQYPTSENKGDNADTGLGSPEFTRPGPDSRKRQVLSQPSGSSSSGQSWEGVHLNWKGKVMYHNGRVNKGLWEPGAEDDERLQQRRDTCAGLWRRKKRSTDRHSTDAVEEIQTKHPWEQGDQIRKAVSTCRVPRQPWSCFQEQCESEERRQSVLFRPCLNLKIEFVLPKITWHPSQCPKDFTQRVGRS